MIRTTNTRVELTAALFLCSMSSDAETILHEPTGTRFTFHELRGTTVVKEPKRNAYGRAIPGRTQERTLSIDEELELRQRRIEATIKAINKQPRKLWEPREKRVAA